MDNSPNVDRRSLLQRGLLLLGGLVGAHALSHPSSGQAAHLPPPSSSPPTTFRVTGRAWGSLPAEPTAWRLAVQQGASHITGEVTAPGGGLGQFQAVPLAAGAPGGPSGLEMHTFTFDDGALWGVGMAGHAPTVFAIIGGSGVYLGARGSYVADLQPHGLGGDGTADFTFTLLV